MVGVIEPDRNGYQRGKGIEYQTETLTCKHCNTELVDIELVRAMINGGHDCIEVN